MAVKRENLKAMGLNEEQITSIIEMHTETVDGLKEKLKAATAKADQYDAVKTELDGLKGGNESWKAKYDALQKTFDSYKNEIVQKEAKAAKESAVKAYFEGKGITGANLEIASKAQKGAKFAPINKGANISDKGAKSCTKGGKICRQDNNIIIYKNIFFQAREDSLATEKGRKEEIYKLFFFKNSTSPNVEVEEFYRVNVLNDWKDGKGAKMDTSMSKLLAWADGWNLKGGSNRTNSYFLNAWREIYNDAIARFDPMAKRLLDPRIKCDSDSQQVLITAPKPLVSWLEKYLVEGNNRIADVMRGFCRGRKLMYNLLES